MTTKFSQAKGVQTLPPVCRSAVVILPIFQMPFHLDILAYLHWHTKRYDGTYNDDKITTRLTWSESMGRWHRKTTWPYFTVNLDIIPAGLPVAMRIYTQIAQVGTTWWNQNYFGPNWKYPDIWKSGEHTFHVPATGSWCWQNFTMTILAPPPKAPD